MPSFLLYIVILVLCALSGCLTIISFVRLVVYIQLVHSSDDIEMNEKTKILQLAHMEYRLVISPVLFNKQRYLRACTLFLLIIFTGMRICQYIVESESDNSLYRHADKRYFLISTVINLTFWMGYALYTPTVLDRFERVEMILSHTWKSYLLQCIIIYVVVCTLFQCLSCLVCDISWVIWNPVNVCDNAVEALQNLLFFIAGFSFMLIEVVINIRMVFTSMKATAAMSPEPPRTLEMDQEEPNHLVLISAKPQLQSVSLPSTPFSLNSTFEDINHPTSDQQILSSDPSHREKKKPNMLQKVNDVGRMFRKRWRKHVYMKAVQRDMILLFGGLLLIDMIILFVQAASKLFPDYARECVCFALILITLRFYLGFALLDVFLFKLKETKNITFHSGPKNPSMLGLTSKLRPGLWDRIHFFR